MAEQPGVKMTAVEVSNHNPRKTPSGEKRFEKRTSRALSMKCSALTPLSVRQALLVVVVLAEKPNLIKPCDPEKTK